MLGVRKIRGATVAYLHIAPLIEAIHLVQELQQDTLNLPVGTSLCIKPLRRNGINLINEDDGGSILSSQAEDISDHARTLTEILLYKFRPNNTDEGCCCMMCHGFHQHSFSGA